MLEFACEEPQLVPTLGDIERRFSMPHKETDWLEQAVALAKLNGGLMALRLRIDEEIAELGAAVKGVQVVHRPATGMVPANKDTDVLSFDDSLVAPETSRRSGARAPMSDETRSKIAKAQKTRHAAVKKAAAKRTKAAKVGGSDSRRLRVLADRDPVGAEALADFIHS